MKVLKLYLIAAALVPKETRDATGADTTPAPTIVVPPKHLFACTEAHARALLLKEIPVELLDRPDELTTYVVQITEGKTFC